MKGSEVALTINGVLYKVPESLPADTTLNEFIRTAAHLKGTKFMCLEGGCGACIVTAKRKDPATGKDLIFAVNSCLTPIFACHGWAITTVEGIGSKATGYNKVQSRLASFSGTQCGYCSPGMVMNMYSLMKGNEQVTMKAVENSFGGNICRCTGYRPILDAFKSLCTDSPKDFYPDKCADIEDFPKVCPKTAEICTKICNDKNRCHTDEHFNEEYDFLYVDNLALSLANNTKWYKVDGKKEIFEIFDMIDDPQSYQLVAGNTAHGVYRNSDFDFYIDINSVAELSDWNLQDNALNLGANITLTKAMSIFESVSKKYPKFSYLKAFADHIDLIANVPVRNVGTLAGNLSIKNQHTEFPSDIYLMFVTVGAMYTYETPMGSSDIREVEELIETDMRKKLITSFVLPSLDDSYIVKTYKIMPRAQNAHAYVNAGFKIKLGNKDTMTVSEASIVYGGIRRNFVHASQTENFLVGKSLLDSHVVQGALDKLASEVDPDVVLTDASPAYRKGLAQSLFYKFVLSLKPTSISPKYRSGGEKLVRPLSSGKQSFDSDEKMWPVNKAMPKLEAYSQCSGEAEFSNDVLAPPGELYGAFVLAPVGPGILDSIDTSASMAMNGVKSFFSAKNIPGLNSFTPVDAATGAQENELLFAEKEVLFAGQPVGLLIATSQHLANKAAKRVKVHVKDVKKPLTSTQEVLSSGDKSRIKPIKTVERKLENAASGKNIIKGVFEIKEQYHFTMETQVCLAVPTEEGLDVYPSSQFLSMIQRSISQCLKLPENCINVQNRRVGGGYGSKISRNSQVATACALAAYILRKPVRVMLTIETNMQSVGKRIPCLSTYEVSVDDAGKIQYLNLDIHQDLGSSWNENAVSGTLAFLASGYDSRTWNINGFAVRTDKSSNTWCRAPGSAEAIATIEHILDHIATVLNKDPVDVRTANFSDDYKEQLVAMITQLKETSDFDNRKQQIKEFNEKNRWRKKGISLVPMRYPMGLWGNYHALISIYQSDGTVSIAHGGIEMGQGINTKAAQVCAYKFGIDVSMVKIKPTNVLTAPNNAVSGGSMASEAVSLGVIKCCDVLLARLAPIKAKLGPDADWQKIIGTAAAENVDLCANYMYTNKDFGEKVSSYDIFGVAALEVEVDVLTGNYLIQRCDIIEDAGVSLSPEVDIGQVEGAFVMGLGYWLTEEIIFDPNTGSVLTDRTWNYKPPGAKDIPVDLHVTLLKNGSNPVGVLRSKATGEPPLCMSCGVMFALRDAINSSLADAGKQKQWIDIKVPFTPEKVFLAASAGTQEYKL
nr:PREDICTED: xanthine dehydrogenase-like [Bemisia tabaci]